MTFTSQQVVLKTRPVGLPDGDTFSLVSTEVGDPGPGELVVRTELISLDPAMRGWLNDVRSYVPPVAIGEVMRAGAVGTVIASQHPDFAVGASVRGTFGVTEHALSDGTGVEIVDTDTAPAATWLGALGMPGMTAYFGLTDVGRVQAGDTVLVSAAAGAVGSVAGQIAKALGAIVIGVAGGAEKCAWLTEIGFDAAIDYKSENVSRRLREIAPDGVDVFFDNVGGVVLDAALANLRRGARIVLSGAVSTYNDTALAAGPKRYMSLLVFRASMIGFVIFDYEDRFPEAQERILAWMREGRLVARETVVDGGVPAFGETLLGLYRGINTGKLVLAV